MKAYHICHHNDEDGIAAAAVIYEYLKRITKISSEEKVLYFFYKIDYTMDLKTVLPKDIPAGDELYFVDYSFSNKDNLKYILELSTKDIKVTWIDHHKTSLVALIDEDICFDNYKNFCHFIDIDYCGAYLAYVYAYFKLNGIHEDVDLMHVFKKDYPKYIPLYLRYVDSWDTWKHDMPNTVEFNIGMRSVDHTPRNTLSSMLKYNSGIINKLFSRNKEDNKLIDVYMEIYINNIINNGTIIKAYEDINNKSLCEEYGFEFDIIDDTAYVYHCFAMNKRGSSTMFGDKVNEYDIVIPFQFNGKKYVYSLFTTKDYVDCEKLAKKLGSVDGLGGGGHSKAAGFQTYRQLFKANCVVYIKNKLLGKNDYKVIIK